MHRRYQAVFTSQGKRFLLRYTTWMLHS